MNIKFLSKCRMEIVESFDEKTETAETSVEVFDVGDIAEADIIDQDENRLTATLQFGDGSVAFNIPQTWFEVIDGR